MKLNSTTTIGCATDDGAVRMAASDVGRDLSRILGAGAAGDDIIVAIDRQLPGPERYRIEIGARRAIVTGSDALGAIYGVYEFSCRFLGVDPLWFWKDVYPARREEIVIESQTVQSRPFTFRYRGWFVNDEDLLSEWKSGGGRREIDYPFYGQVIHPDVAEAIYEALLRSQCNLVIPASFVDVMNPSEARLIARAAARGLYVSQHHIEPLGVSHFGFENYWRRRGPELRFSLIDHRFEVEETWRAYARAWHELAGDRVIWQLGLRGRGDTPVWNSDPKVTRAAAGEWISQALARQLEIVREIDSRPRPPATMTLWMEGSELMSQGSLRLPKGVTCVFSDAESRQEMQQDFHRTDRRPGATYGVYYHVCMWWPGAHLVQGLDFDTARTAFDAIVAKGDTHYAIANVSNIREHVFGIDTVSRLMTGRVGPPPDPLYRGFFQGFIPMGGVAILQDGVCWLLIQQLLDVFEGKRADIYGTLYPPGASDWPGSATLLEAGAGRLQRFAGDFPAKAGPFLTPNLRLQAEMLRWYYTCAARLLRRDFDRAGAALAELLSLRPACEQGKWEGWYRGDRKANVSALLDRIRKVAQKVTP